LGEILNKALTMYEAKQCILCKVSEEKMPLIAFQFKNETHHICSAHIPVLIHKAHELRDVLPGLDLSSEKPW
jgi:hypothetical protein